MSLKVEIEKGSIEWNIEDFFTTSPTVGEVRCSPPFHISNASWCLHVYPNGETRNTYGWIGIFLKKEKSETELHEVLYKLGIKAIDGTEIISMKYTSIFGKSNSTYGWNKFYELTKLQREKRKLFPDGIVTFFCQAHLIGRENTVDADSQKDIRHCFYGLSQNFKDLFVTEVGADVTIKLKDGEFLAHSQILSARSPVFAAMFRHDTKEKNTGVVEIPEYDPDVFREFLIFLYSGQAEKLTSQNVIALYSVADKYDIEDLKSLCSEFMVENISLDSICSFLSLALTYEDKDLIDCARIFFIKNVKKIIETVEWMSFAKQYPEESNRLFIIIAQSFVPD